jgi:hypothetical protein
MAGGNVIRAAGAFLKRPLSASGDCRGARAGVRCCVPLTKIERASASTGQQAHTAAEQYEYDYDYIPPLALIKSVPGLGFSLEWAVLVFAVGLRVLVNLIALKIDKDPCLPC